MNNILLFLYKKTYFYVILFWIDFGKLPIVIIIKTGAAVWIKVRRVKMSSKIKNAGMKAKELLSERFVKETLAIYLFFMFVIYPLYYQDKYFNMGEAKWSFFKTVTYFWSNEEGQFLFPGILLFLMAFFCWFVYDIFRVNRAKEWFDLKKMSLTDAFVIGYFVFCLISSILTPYKNLPEQSGSVLEPVQYNVLGGYAGWYMGLVAQIAFVLIYYFVSRFWRWDSLMMVLYLSAASLVFLFGVLNRFMIDPLGMYTDLDANYISQFLSTLGQATWYSSYVVQLFPIGLFIYWYSERAWVRKLSFAYTVLGSMTLITQGSDSAFYAIAAIISTLFFFSFMENKYILRWLEAVLIMLLSWRVIGFLQMAFPEQAVDAGTLMNFGSKNPLLWILIIALTVVYYFARKADKEGKLDINNLLIIRKIYFAVLIIGIVGGIIYIILNTNGLLPESLSSDNWYLLFNDKWGSDRGGSWRVTVDSVFKTITDDPVRFFFGAGPDGFFNTVYIYHSDFLFKQWGENTILTCAHNEFLTQIVNIGIFGGIAYTGIFISAIVRFGKKASQHPETIAAIMCITAYMAHNFFCYQQIICTPVIFIIIGAGECLSRVGRKAIWETE